MGFECRYRTAFPVEAPPPMNGLFLHGISRSARILMSSNDGEGTELRGAETRYAVSHVLLARKNMKGVRATYS